MTQLANNLEPIPHGRQQCLEEAVGLPHLTPQFLACHAAVSELSTTSEMPISARDWNAVTSHPCRASLDATWNERPRLG